MKLPLTWDLDRIYTHDTASETLQKITADIEAIQKTIESKQELKTVIDSLQTMHLHIREASSYITCLNAQNVHDTQAHIFEDRMTTLHAAFATLLVHFDEWLLSLSDESFESLLQQEKEIAFPLAERRQLAKKKTPCRPRKLHP